jgi:hypothetical protein
MKKHLTLIALVAVFCLLLAAADCKSSFINTSKRTLYTLKAGWYDVQDNVKAFAEANKIPPLGIQQFRTLDNKFKTAHRAATDTLQSIEIIANAQGQARVSVLISELFKLMVEMVDLYRQWNLPPPKMLLDLTKEVM